MNNREIDILLAEDNPNDSELTLRALRKNNIGNNLHHVKDGAEALDFLFGTGEYSERKQQLPKLILLDLKMPKVSGLEVLKIIRENELTRNIPVVVLTSSNQEKDIVESYNLGVNSYIVKPVEFDKYTNTVSELGQYWMQLNRTSHCH